MTEQERQDRLWLEPEPLRETWRDRAQRLTLWEGVKIVLGLAGLVGYALWERLKGVCHARP